MKDLRGDDILAQLIKSYLNKVHIPEKEIDDIIIGCSIQEQSCSFNVAKCSTNRKFKYSIPGMTINRLCASGLESIAIASAKMANNTADCIIAEA